MIQVRLLIKALWMDVNLSFLFIPVCGGNKGFNCHLSELLSLLLEPTGHAMKGKDIESTSELLSKVEDLNEKMKHKYNSHGERVNINEEDVKDKDKTMSEENVNNKKEEKKKEVVKDLKREKTKFDIDLKELRVKYLRNLKLRGTNIPNIKSKLWAARIQDELCNN